MAQKNLKCPKCKANAFHIDRNEDGTYTIKCMRSIPCERKIKLEEDTLCYLQ